MHETVTSLETSSLTVPMSLISKPARRLKAIESRNPFASPVFLCPHKCKSVTPFPFKELHTRPPSPRTHLLAHGAGTPLASVGLGGLGLGNTLGEDLGVLVLHMGIRLA